MPFAKRLRRPLRSMAIGIAVLAAAATVGIAGVQPAVLMIVPWVLTFVYVYQLQVHADVMALAAARARIGELLERDLGAEPIVADRVGAHATADRSTRA